MPPILTEDEINRQFRIPYIIGGLMLIGGAITIGYGFTNIPTQIPQYNIQYEVITSVEKKNADLQNYQYNSDPFKIGMCGLVAFMAGMITCIRYVYLNRASLEKFYECQEQRTRQQQQQQKRVIVTEPKQDTVTIRNLTEQQQQQQQQPLQAQRQPQQQLQPLQVRRQQQQQQQSIQVQRQPYIPYRGHLPPEYREVKVYPQA